MLSLLVAWCPSTLPPRADVELFEPVAAVVDARAVQPTARRTRAIRVSPELVASERLLEKGDVARA